MKTATLSAMLVIVSMFLMLGCSSAPVVKDGDKVKVHYVGTLEDGEKFDSSEGRDPLEFVVGQGQMIAGFDRGVLGMTVGEKKTITLTPEDAYGYPSDDKVMEVDRSQFPPDMELTPGMDLVAPGGFPVKVKDVTDSMVIIDTNHPLAGKTLIFELELVEIGEADAAPEPQPEPEPETETGG